MTLGLVSSPPSYQKKTQAQRGSTTCPESHSSWGKLKPKFPMLPTNMIVSCHISWLSTKEYLIWRVSLTTNFLHLQGDQQYSPGRKNKGAHSREGLPAASSSLCWPNLTKKRTSEGNTLTAVRNRSWAVAPTSIWQLHVFVNGRD